jgi:hypothetical protein
MAKKSEINKNKMKEKKQHTAVNNKGKTDKKAVTPRKSKNTPASKAVKDVKKRTTKEVEKKMKPGKSKSKEKTEVKTPRTISTSVKRERKQWANLRNAQLSDKTKVAVEPMRRMIRQIYAEVSEAADTKVKVERMDQKAEKLLLEQGVQYLTEWCSEVQRNVEMGRRDMPVDSDLAAATYTLARVNRMTPPPSQQSVHRRYADFPKSSVKHIARSTMRSVNNLDSLGLLTAEEGSTCYKDAKKAARKRNRVRARALAAADEN